MPASLVLAFAVIAAVLTGVHQQIQGKYIRRVPTVYALLI